MPVIKTQNKIFMLYRGVTIFHSYKEDDYEVDSPMTYFYSLNEFGEGDFDVRDLTCPESINEEDHKAIIAAAIDSGELKVDYFQVLAIFAQSNVKWPDILIEFFNIFSYINFNIDVAAPECLTPNLDFRLKWYMQLGLPIGVAAMLALSFVVVYVWKKFINGQSGAVLTAHLSPSITALVTAMYVLYLLLCRRVFDVFNCNPTVPPDPRGTLYMEATNSPCRLNTCPRLKPRAPVAIGLSMS